MLACTLVLALVGAPDPAEPTQPPPATEIPSWRSAPEPSQPPEPEPKPTRVPLPNDGSGVITLGSMMIVGGSAMTAISIGHAFVPGPQGEVIVASHGALALTAGTIMLAVGIMTRTKHRNSIPDAPRSGSGMQLGGLALLASGGIATIFSGIDLGTVVCAGTECYPYRPLTAQIGLGCGLGGVVVGSGLLIAGSLRKRKYRRWAESRLPSASAIQPTFVAGRTGIQLGLAGRF